MKTIFTQSCKNVDDLKNKLVEYYCLNDEKHKDLKFVRKIYLNQKVLYKEGIYLLRSFGETQINLLNCYQNYLDEVCDLDSDSKYILRGLKYLELSQLDISKEKIEVQTSKDGRKKLVFDKNRNLDILKKLIGIAAKNNFSKCGYINKIGHINSYDKFNELSIGQQIMVIYEIIKLFTVPDKCKLGTVNCFDGLGKNFEYKPSTKLDGDIVLIHESVTGLLVRRERF